MKNNVDVMDEDMNHVRSKMTQICNTTKTLDETLIDKRTKVSVFLSHSLLFNKFLWFAI